MANVDEIRKIKVFCPHCLAQIYDHNQMHACGQKRLIGARQISITLTDTDGFSVQEGNRFINQLGWGEMLEVVIGLTHSGLNKHAPYGPMMTAEEWAERDRRWHEKLDDIAETEHGL